MRYRILGSIALGIFLLVVVGVWGVRQGMPPGAPEAPSAAADDPVFPPLVMAARSGEVEAIGELIRAGADPNLMDSGRNEWTPLLHAVHKNQVESVRTLIAAGADVNRPAPNGLIPLSLAATQGEAEIVEELLAAGADPRSRDSHGWTVLQRALGSGNPRVVEALLRKDPDLRLGNGPRDWMARGIARLQGDSDILARLHRKEDGQ